MVVIDNVMFDVTTVKNQWELHANVYCDKHWDSDKDLHVAHLEIVAHNCGSSFAKAFNDEFAVADVYTICSSAVDFIVRDFEPAVLEELIQDFFLSWLLGKAPFALEHGWWCTSRKAQECPIFG